MENQLEYLHLIITRFNIPWPKTDKNGITHNHLGQWLETRVKMFEQYCLPSVKAQTEQNFKWLLLFDYRTPNHFYTRLKEYKNIEICLVDKDPNENHASVSQKAVRKYLVGSKPNYLITTRFDNDDMLYKGFTASIKTYFEQRQTARNEIVQFPNGIELDFKLKKWVKIKDFGSNAFISLIEKYNPDDVKTAMFDSHRQMIDHFEITNLANYYAWCRNVHQFNLRNKITQRKLFYLRGMKSLRKKGFVFND